MSDEVAVLGVKIESDKAVQNIDLLESKFKGLGKVATDVATVIGSAFAGSKIVGFGGDLLKSAADAQEALGKYEAVFKNLSKEADKSVSELTKSYNFSTQLARGSLSTMADIFQKSGMSMKNSLDMSAELNKLSADVEAFTNAEGGLAQVTSALTSAILGETEAAKTLGIVILDAMVAEQMAAEKKKGLTFQSEQQAKMHARFTLIQKNAANAIGQVARESDNYGNKLRVLNAKIKDLKDTLGEALIDPASKVVGVLSTAAGALKDMSPAAKTAVVATGAVGAAVALLGIPLTKIILGYKTYAAIVAKNTTVQTVSEVATKAQVSSEASLAEVKSIVTSASIAEMESVYACTNAEKVNTSSKTANTNAEKIKVMAIDSTISSIAIQTRALDMNTAAWSRNSASKPTVASRGMGGIAKAAGIKGSGVYSLTGLGKSKVSSIAAPKFNDGQLSTLQSFFTGSTSPGRAPSTVSGTGKVARASGLIVPEAYKDSGKQYGNMAKMNPISKGNVLGTGSKMPIDLASFKQSPAWMAELKTITGPGVLSKFVSVLAKIPKFISPVLKLVGRFAGPVAAVVGAITLVLEGLKHAPKLLETFMQEWWPPIKTFCMELPGKIGGWISSAWDSATSYLGNLVGEGLNGLMEVGMRIAGFETETQREYELEKQREELLEKQRRNSELKAKIQEQDVRLANQEAEGFAAQMQARDGYMSGRMTDLGKQLQAYQTVEKKTAELQKQQQIAGNTQLEINNIDRAMEKDGLSYDQLVGLSSRREDLVNENAEANKSIISLTGEVWKARADYDKASEDVQKNLDDQQKDREKLNEEKIGQEREKQDYELQKRYENATTSEEKIGALSGILAQAEKDIEESKAAQIAADNAGIDQKAAQYWRLGDSAMSLDQLQAIGNDPRREAAMLKLREIGNANEINKTPEKKELFRQTAISLGFGELAGLKTGDITNEVMSDVLTKALAQNEGIPKLIAKATEERDKNLEKAGNLQDYVQTADDTKAKIKDVQDEGKKKAKEKAEKEDEYTMRGMNDKQKAMFLSSKVAAYDQTVTDYETKTKRISELQGRLGELGPRAAGWSTPLSDAEKAELKSAKEEIEKLKKEVPDKETYEENIEKRRDLELKIDELVKPEIEKTFQEDENFAKKAPRTMQPGTAIDSSSSEGFKIANTLYNQQTRTVEKNTNLLVEYTRTIRERLISLNKTAQEDTALEVE